MIGSLRGALLDRLGDTEVLVEVAGVGYRVTVAPSTVVQLGDVGGEVFLHIHHHIREDAQTLYGFRSAEERRCFEALLGAHGVGPALALAILSIHDPVALARVLAADDLAALCLVPGVGKKTAARLLVELKSRLDVDSLAGAVGPSPAVAGAVPVGVGASPLADVRDALAELGYATEEVTGVLRDLPADGEPALLLKQALQKLAVG
jgi:holliday junction DNA helicase RuvA